MIGFVDRHNTRKFVHHIRVTNKKKNYGILILICIISLFVLQKLKISIWSLREEKIGWTTKTTEDKEGEGEEEEEEEVPEFVRYWRKSSDISDEERYYRSPFISSRPSSDRFCTFTQDISQMNNQRLNFEFIVALCAALNRTIVLPAKLFINDRCQTCNISYDQLYNLKGLRDRPNFVRIKDMESYLQRLAPSEIVEAFRDANPSKRTVEDQKHTIWLRESGYMIPFGSNIGNNAHGPGEPYNTRKPYKRFVHSRSPTIIGFSDRYRSDPLKDPSKTPDVNTILSTRFGVGPTLSSTYDIFRDPNVETARTLHFSKYNRVLGTFYCMLYFENSKLDLYARRMIRDGVRYSNGAFLAAAQIVLDMKRRSSGRFMTLHVRRSDFQWAFKSSWVPAEAVLDAVASFDPDRSFEYLYIATDEKDKTYFEPLLEFYKLMFLDDYAEEIDVPSFMLPEIDQIVASHGTKFLGTKLSTFTAYIIRLRGYLGKSSDSSAYIENPVQPLSDHRACAQGSSWISEYPFAWAY